MMLRCLILSLILNLLVVVNSQSVFAHPVAYKGATSIMTWNQPFMSDHWIVYSFQPNMAIAGRFIRMEMPEGELNYSGLQYDYLVQRWNGSNHQANIYIYGGAGDISLNRENGIGYFGGFEADIEDRKYFALIKAESMQTDVADDFNHVEGRLGIAPYEAEYDEMAAWFMVQGQWHPTLKEKFVFTPLARLFYKSFMMESGVSLEGDWMMNFMFHF